MMILFYVEIILMYLEYMIYFYIIQDFYITQVPENHAKIKQLAHTCFCPALESNTKGSVAHHPTLCHDEIKQTPSATQQKLIYNLAAVA